MKEYYVHFYTDLKSETYKFRYKKDALEKYNEIVDHCYFPMDCVHLVCSEIISKYPDVKEEF